MSIAALDLDLEVFNGPFDLLLTLVLKEEIDLLEVDLAEVVLAYVEHLERAGELDLEAATEFLVLIAALLELKSRLMLPSDEEEGLDIEPVEAAEELLARMLEYHRYRQAAEHLRARLEAEHGYRYRSAPLPPALRRISLEVVEVGEDDVGEVDLEQVDLLAQDEGQEQVEGTGEDVEVEIEVEVGDRHPDED